MTEERNWHQLQVGIEASKCSPLEQFNKRMLWLQPNTDIR
jgi:hypothetical protein